MSRLRAHLYNRCSPMSWVSPYAVIGVTRETVSSRDFRMSASEPGVRTVFHLMPSGPQPARLSAAIGLEKCRTVWVCRRSHTPDSENETAPPVGGTAERRGRFS